MNPEVMNARWNLRKLVKELLLLEEHLTDPEQQCSDCIWKHLLKSEAWLEEAATLDGQGEFTPLLQRSGERLKAIQETVKLGELRMAAIAARRFRKVLMGYAVNL